MVRFARWLLPLSLVLHASCAPLGRPTCEGRPRSQCVEDLAVGDGFGCAVLRDRTVWCWGRNDDGQLGYGSAALCPITAGAGMTRSVACHDFPQQVAAITGATSAVAGGAQACAWGEAMIPQCWGANESGQLGTGAMFSSPTPAMVRGADLATVSVSAGARHACRVSAGRVYCWGANDRGQLGDGAPGAEGSSAAVRVLTESGALYGVTSLAAGTAHTCALREDHAVLCWGSNERGQLGVAVAMSAPMGCAGPCAPRAVTVTGFEGTGQLPRADASFRIDGATPDAAEPEFDGGARADSAAVDARADGTVERSDGGAMDGAMDAAVSPRDAQDERRTPATPRPTTVSVGGDSACARIDDGTIRCWGSNHRGQLGDGRAGGFSPTPVLVIASPGAAANNPLQSVELVRVGASSACAKLADRSVRCWGSNEAGALGTGNLSPATGPVPLSW